MFISFEGLDGSGKTTIINMLVEEIKKRYPKLNFVLTREPGGKNVPEAEKLREIILHPDTEISDISEALLYSASRRMHLEKVVWPALAKNELVLCDRYVDSFYAYQGFARNLGLEYTQKLTELVINNTMPKITVFFDITPQKSQERREKSRLLVDRLEKEKMEFHQKVYDGYKKIIEKDPERFICVDASLCANSVFKLVWDKLHQNPKFLEYIKPYVK